MGSLEQSNYGSITKPASRVMWGGVFSLVGGLASNIVVALIYGAGANMDAYLTALVIPSVLLAIFYSSLYFVLIPAFIEAEANNNDEDAWSLVGTFFWITAIALSVVSILGSLLSRTIIDVIAPGFQPEKAKLAAQMLSLLIFTTPFMGISTLTAGIQNARKSFFWPAIAPAFGYFGNVIVLLGLSHTVGPMALCWGYVASNIIQTGFTTMPVLSHGWTRTFPLNDARVSSIMKLILPLIFFGILISFSPIAERYFASVLPDGQIAYIGYANKVSSIFVILLASGIATTIFPSMANTFAKDGLPGLSAQSDFGLRLTFAIALPTTLILGAISVPLITIFFERGAFLHSDTLGVERILFPFLLGDIIVRMVGNISQRSFYVMKDTTTQSVVTSVFIVFYIAFARFFVTQWGYVGLVWASAIRQALTVFTIWMLLLRKFPKKDIQTKLIYFLKYLGAAFVAYIGGRAVVQALAPVPVFFQLAAGGTASLLLYLLILYCFDRDILKPLFELFGIHLNLEKLAARGERLLGKNYL